MFLPIISLVFLTYVSALLAMAFYTLLERKALGYAQARKGPNKVGLMGLPQPFADALKLLTKEQKQPFLANMSMFMAAPMLSLILAMLIWTLLPSFSNSNFLNYGLLLFLAVSSLNVYSTLGSGWSSNSKYSLLGALRSIAQTVSYEVSMTLILLGALMLFLSYNFLHYLSTPQMALFMIPITGFMWFITTLAETNRTPFDFAEGESELVSGFNTEYSSGAFAMIFMAEYASIIIMGFLTAILLMSHQQSNPTTLNFILLPLKATLMAFLYIWARGTLPRMRYDRLMNLTWKCFLPFSLSLMILFIPVCM